MAGSSPAVPLDPPLHSFSLTKQSKASLQNPPHLPVIKCMTIGDEGSKKIKLLQSLSHLVTKEPHNNRNIFEGHPLRLEAKGGAGVTLSLWDVSGQEDYSSLRQLMYNKMDIFFLCFAINNPQSFRSIKDNWYREVKCHCPKAQFILVGTRLEKRKEHERDERKERSTLFITKQQGLQMKRLLGARDYVEVSYKTNEGVEELITAIRDYQSNSTNYWERHKSCDIL